MRRLSSRSVSAIGVGVSALVLGLVGLSAGSAYGNVYEAPYLSCFDESFADMATLRASLVPAEGAAVPVGAPVTFTGNARAPVTFAVASSPTLLATPDIDSGLGSAQPALGEGYSFTSTKTSAKPGTVYWDASFSTAGFKECEGQTPKIETTQPRALTVLAPAVPAVLSPTLAPPVVQIPPIQVSIDLPRSVHLSGATLFYGVRCSARCSGATSYEVYVVRRHNRAVHVSRLDLNSYPVSIVDEPGGEQQITHEYAGRLLRMLERIIHAGDVVELRISVKVTGASGNPAQARRTARLKI
jgi:hypothetical protein